MNKSLNTNSRFYYKGNKINNKKDIYPHNLKCNLNNSVYNPSKFKQKLHQNYYRNKNLFTANTHNDPYSNEDSDKNFDFECNEVLNTITPLEEDKDAPENTFKRVTKVIKKKKNGQILTTLIKKYMLNDGTEHLVVTDEVSKNIN